LRRLAELRDRGRRRARLPLFKVEALHTPCGRGERGRN
jgi:hypothetical protein